MRQIKTYHPQLLCLFFCVAVITSLTCCKSSGCTITEQDILHDTLILHHTKHDSIYERDSIYIREYMRGDTVFLDNVRIQYRYRDRIKRDSIYVAKRDTVTNIVTVEKEKSLNTFQRLEMWLGEMVMVLAFLAMAIGLGWLFARKAR